MTLQSRYLPQDARSRLEQYVYKGEDKSYLYKKFWSPLVRRLVRYLPVWLAPNVITVAALAGVCIVHVLFALRMPFFSVVNTYTKESPDERLHVNYNAYSASYGDYLPPPRYVLLLAALTLFLYQLLDNLDGHQARRTGTSSPLGLLMDHGCDAFNCIVGALNLCSTLATGPCWKTFLVLTNTLVVFFFNTWEEYYRGELVLPVINGPNEGIVIAIGFYLWTAWKGGPQWWSSNAVEIPSEWLPSVLRQPAPDAAVAVEKVILQKVCPLLTRADRDSPEGFSALPFFFNLNCTPAYMANPTRPTLRVPPPQESNPIMSNLWRGNGPIQHTVLRLYGSNEVTLRMRYNTIAVWVMTLMALVTLFSHVREVFRAIRRIPAADLRTKFGATRFPLLHALSRTIPILSVTALSVVWFITSQEDIFRRHPRLFCWTVGLLSTKLTIHLMMSHLLAVPFRPFRRTLVPFIVFAGHIFLTYLHNVNRARKELMKAGEGNLTPIGGSGGENGTVEGGYTNYAYYAYDMDEEMILYEFFALSLISFVHLVYHVIKDTAKVLEVPVFTVPKEKQIAVKGKEEEEKRKKKKKH